MKTTLASQISDVTLALLPIIENVPTFPLAVTPRPSASVTPEFHDSTTIRESISIAGPNTTFQGNQSIAIPEFFHDISKLFTRAFPHVSMRYTFAGNT